MALYILGLALAVLSALTGLWHQQTVGWGESKVLLGISFAFALVHGVFYLWKIWTCHYKS